MRNKRILIVDDDPDILHSMHLRLKANNYDTFFAADARMRSPAWLRPGRASQI
jgi:DNA-binding response OmpR family regulator